MSTPLGVGEGDWAVGAGWVQKRPAGLDGRIFNAEDDKAFRLQLYKGRTAGFQGAFVDLLLLAMCRTRQHLSWRPLSHNATCQLPGVFADLGHRRSVHWRQNAQPLGSTGSCGWLATILKRPPPNLFGPLRRKATTFMVLLLRGAKGMFVL